MTGNYNSWLVVLSIVVASFASYVALDLASRVAATQGTRHSRYWLFGGALSMGTGIWSMHFIGMLAFQLPIPMSYDVPITLASLLIAVIVSGFALYTISHGTLSLRRLLEAGFLMGGGIACMHYTGMAAMQMAPPVRYYPPLFVASVVIAIFASVVALWIAFQLRTQTFLSALWRKAGSALVMGFAITGMHYTGMASAIFAPDAICTVNPQDINNVWLAGAIAGFNVLFLATTLVVSVFDERTAMLRALSESEARKGAILEASMDAIVTMDHQGHIVEFNPAAERCFGYTREQAIGGKMAELVVPPELRERHHEGMRRYLATGEAKILGRNMEFPALRADGSRFDAELTISLIPGSDPPAFTGTLRDITERKRAEHELQRFQMAMDVSVDSIYLTDPATMRFVYANNTACQRLGYTREQLLQMGPQDVLPVGREQISQEYDEVIAAGDQGLRHERPFVRSDGSEGWTELHRRALRTDGVTLIVTIGRDITERRRTEDDLLRFRLAMDSSADMILLVDRAAMRFVDANSTVCRLLGYTREELLAMRPEELLPVSREELEAAYDRQIADPSVAGGMTSYYRCRDGSRLPFESKRQVLRSGDRVLISVVSRDIRERIQAESALRESEARFRALTELSSDLYWETDAEHRVSKYSYGAKIDLIVPVNELLGRRRWEIPAVIPDEEGWRAHRATLDAHLPFRDFETARRGGDGRLRHFSLSGEPMFDAGGAFTGYRGVGREITEQKTVEARLDQLAHYDTLTGLPNRALLHDRMRRAMARADRGQTLLAVMFLDLDRFKEINDSLGHAAGDEVLKEAARRLQACLRSTDTVGRLGGDEFTVLLEDIHHVDEISTLARKVLDAFAEPAGVAGHELRLSTSIGVTVYPLDDQDADTLLRNADMAMYQAKQEGRNNFQFFAAEMGARTERRADLRLRLHRALERGEFALHYQPQVALASGGIFGVESLLRWTDAELGPVSPAQFIPVAEEMGLIVPLGDWVLREACRQCKAWLDGGLGPLRVAVNLSPRQFRHKKLARRIGEILHETGLPAACLEIEITEGIVMKHAERAIKTLTELNQLGVQIAIDDFGTGYSSLAYLQRFPVHVLKIDQSFVQAIRGRTDQAPIVNTVIQLAKQLGLKNLAEGVETLEQQEYLRAHGCDAFQGYLFCKPQSAERIGELLAAHRRERAVA